MLQLELRGLRGIDMNLQDSQDTTWSQGVSLFLESLPSELVFCPGQTEQIQPLKRVTHTTS